MTRNRTETVPASLRWLAILTGCSSAVFLYSAFGAPFLILGAAIQPRAPTTGRWLMWVGALLLNLFIVPLTPEIVDGMGKPTLWHTWGVPLMAVATLLMYCCDVALVIEGFRARRIPWTRGRQDWVVWTVAVVLSAWLVWVDRDIPGIVYAYQHGFWQAILPSVALGAMMLVFDAALVAHAVKVRKA